MFVLSKLLAFVTQPLFWVLALLTLAAFWAPRHPRRSKAMVLWSVGFVLLLGWPAPPQWLIARLESGHERPSEAQILKAQGVVVLGGMFTDPAEWQGRNTVGLNSAAERITETVVLARRYPHLQILFTGGEGTLVRQGVSEAQAAQRFLAQMGVAPDRIWLEDASRNTRENAVLSARIAGVDVQRPWLVLTSAWHMRRSLRQFEIAQWQEPIAYPVDWRSGQPIQWLNYRLWEGLSLWQLFLHELLGMWVYG